MVRTNYNKNAAKQLYLSLSRSIEDEPTATTNPKAIVCNVGGRMIGITSRQIWRFLDIVATDTAK